MKTFSAYELKSGNEGGIDRRGLSRSREVRNA
jgi:hypothetical protein